MGAPRSALSPRKSPAGAGLRLRPLKTALDELDRPFGLADFDVLKVEKVFGDLLSHLRIAVEGEFDHGSQWPTAFDLIPQGCQEEASSSRFR